MDDFILLCADSVVTDHIDVVHTFEDFGLVINRNKSDFTRLFCEECIGYVIDTDGPGGVPWLYIPNKRIRHLRKDIHRWLKCRRLGVRQVASISGQCSAMCKSILLREDKITLLA